MYSSDDGICATVLQCKLQNQRVFSYVQICHFKGTEKEQKNIYIWSKKKKKLDFYFFHPHGGKKEKLETILKRRKFRKSRV